MKAFLLLTALWVLLVAEAQGANAPNVLVVMADDLGFNDVGYNGSRIRTPVLDELAGQGVVLDHFYAHPVCSPTRAALMSGDAPARTGVLRPFGKNSPNSLPLDRKLMPAYFREAGYQTFLVGKWHLGRATVAQLPTSRGFDHFYGHLTGGIGFWDKVHGGGYDWQRNGVTLREPGYATHQMGAEAERLLTGRDAARPFFMLLSFNAPHLPAEAPADTIASYSEIENVRRRMHAAMVTELDETLGRVIERLQQQGLLENTIIWFFSDNGGLIPAPIPDFGPFMVDREGRPLAEGDPVPQRFIDFITLNRTEGGSDNAPFKRGKGSAYEGGIHVPSLVVWPDRLPARREAALVTVEDMLPTLLALSGIGSELSQGQDGVDQSEGLRGRAAFRERPYVAIGGAEEAYVQMPWKLIRPVRGEPLLFNLRTDPTENENLAAANPGKVIELIRLLDEFPRGKPVTTVAGRIYPDFIWDPDFFGGHEDRPPWADVVSE